MTPRAHVPACGTRVVFRHRDACLGLTPDLDYEPDQVAPGANLAMDVRASIEWLTTMEDGMCAQIRRHDMHRPGRSAGRPTPIAVGDKADIPVGPR